MHADLSTHKRKKRKHRKHRSAATGEKNATKAVAEVIVPGDAAETLSEPSRDLAPAARAELMKIVPVLTAKRAQRGHQRLDPSEYPPMLCNGCEAQSVCPYFKQDNDCAWENQLDFQIESGQDIVNLMLELVRLDARRTKTALLKERLLGGTMNPEVSLRSDALFNKLARIKELAEGERGGGENKGAGIIGALFADELQPVPQLEGGESNGTRNGRG